MHYRACILHILHTLIGVVQATISTGSGTREFDPSQWMKADGTAARMNDSRDNLAFGTGPRRCIGQSLATVEIITALVIMGREIGTLDVPPAEHDIDFGASPEHPTGLPIRFTARGATTTAV